MFGPSFGRVAGDFHATFYWIRKCQYITIDGRILHSSNQVVSCKYLPECLSDHKDSFFMDRRWVQSRSRWFWAIKKMQYPSGRSTRTKKWHINQESTKTRNKSFKHLRYKAIPMLSIACKVPRDKSANDCASISFDSTSKTWRSARSLQK